MSHRASKTALILVAHGDLGGAGSNRAVMDCVAGLRKQLPFAEVSAGFLKAEPNLESLLQALRARKMERVLLYPFMMSNGYFATRVLTARVKRANSINEVQVLQPLGLTPGLGHLMVSQATETATCAGYAPERTRLLIVGHGSKLGRASAEATRNVAGEIVRYSPFLSVSTAFLEEPPFVQTELASEPGPAVVVGFLSGEGLHGAVDVPAAIRESGAEAAYSGPIGAHEGIAALVATAVMCFLDMPN